MKRISALADKLFPIDGTLPDDKYLAPKGSTKKATSSGVSSCAPAPTKKPTPKPTKKPTPKPTAAADRHARSDARADPDPDADADAAAGALTGPPSGALASPRVCEARATLVRSGEVPSAPDAGSLLAWAPAGHWADSSSCSSRSRSSSA